MKKIFLSIILFFVTVCQCFAGSALFFSSLKQPQNPLELSMILCLSNHRPATMDAGINLWKVRRVTAADEIYIWDINPGTNEIKQNSGDSFTAETDTLFVVEWYDASGNGHTATQSTEGYQPELILNSTDNGYPYVDLDGSNDFLEISDDNSLSFTDGSDTAAWCGIRFIPDSVLAAVKIIFGKYQNAGDVEWIFPFVGNGFLRTQFFDDSTGGSIYADVSISESTEYRYIGQKYASADIDVYIDGSDQNVTVNTSGTYVGVENTSRTVRIGTGYSFFNGKMTCIFLGSGELSETDGIDLYMRRH